MSGPRQALGMLAMLAALGSTGTARPLVAGEVVPATAALVDQLGSARYADREAAARAIEAFGPDVLPTLRRVAATHDDAEVRLRAATLARRIKIVAMVDVRELISWLPPDIETLVVARGPLSSERSMRTRVPAILELFRLLACGSSSGPERRAWSRVADALPDRPIDLAMAGGRRSRDHTGDANESFGGCHLLLYRDDPEPLGTAVDANLAAAASHVESLDGHVVAVFDIFTRGRFQRIREFEFGQAQSLFVTRAGPDAIAIASDRHVLAEVLARAGRGGKPPNGGVAVSGAPDGSRAASAPVNPVAGAGVAVLQEAVEDVAPPPRALPESLPEWAFVDPTAPAWAIRHYGDDPTDLTSPRNPSRFALGPIGAHDPRAVGLVVQVEPSGEAVEVRYLSGSDEATVMSVLDRWWLPGNQAQFDLEAPGVLVAHLDTTEPDDAVHAWYAIASALGLPNQGW